jgi:hypothetical protein
MGPINCLENSVDVLPVVTKQFFRAFKCIGFDELGGIASALRTLHDYASLIVAVYQWPVPVVIKLYLPP